MSIIINGKELSEDIISAEMNRAISAGHPDNEQLRDGAIQELILRQLLLEKAASLGVTAATDEETMGALIQQEVPVESVSDDVCQAFYTANPQSFVQGEMASASHILFSAQDEASAGLLKAKAEGVLETLKSNPSQFAALAREHSSCPSGKEGGSLGQFGRGQMVPEFEDAVFSTDSGEITPQLVETQFGYHIIQVTDRKEGNAIAFDEVKDQLKAYLTEMQGRRATHDYLSGLVQEAKIEGYELPAFSQ